MSLCTLASKRSREPGGEAPSASADTHLKMPPSSSLTRGPPESPKPCGFQVARAVQRKVFSVPKVAQLARSQPIVRAPGPVAELLDAEYVLGIDIEARSCTS